MQVPIPHIIRTFINILVPPRPTERLVEQLHLSDLQAYNTDGSLSYRADAVKALVWELKYHAHPKALQLAGAILSEQLLAIVADEIGKPLLIPIPMHPKRRKERGHNQTELLCRAALPYLGDSFTYAPQALIRTEHKAPQQTLNKRERLGNMDHTMAVQDKALLAGRVCVVVDDVATTGATLAEAERALASAHPRKVILITLAHS
jgi:ComF family protein